jgi:inhibitor of growth protein 3
MTVTSLLLTDNMDSLEKRVKTFFSNAKKMKPQDKENEYELIRKDYYKTLEDAGKVTIVNMHNMLKFVDSLSHNVCYMLRAIFNMYVYIFISDEKVHLANQMHDLVERYLRRLDQELHKFKMELEADNKGITEVLEKRNIFALNYI